MGSGVSTSDDLSTNEKESLTRVIEGRYQELKNVLSDSEQMVALKEAYNNHINLIRTNRVKQTETEGVVYAGDHETDKVELDIEKGLSFEEKDDDDDDEEEHYVNNFRLKSSKSMIYQPFLYSNSSKNESHSERVRSKSSAQLLDLAQSAIQEEHDKLTNFVASLKAGDVTPKVASNFRIRRLTYKNHGVDDEGSPSKSSPDKKSPVRQASIKAPLTGTKRIIRTTIFASSEIGQVTETTPPFPESMLGTYSCHGIEPSYYEDDGVIQKINQDRACVVYPYNSSTREALFMVLDGHGEQGDKVSEFAMRQIVVSLEKDASLQVDPVGALSKAFVSTDAALVITEMNCMTSGCTCVAVYVRGTKLYVANVGDSRAVMAYKPLSKADDNSSVESPFLAKNLSRDHKPDDPIEMERIVRMGGFVCPPQEEGLSARVYLDPNFTMIGLAMGRSIGDHAVKSVGVIADPEVLEFDVDPEDQFMIMASDGVWEFISSQEAVDIVNRSLQDGTPAACQALIEEAASRWRDFEGDYRDDITAIVVKFPLPYTE